MFSFLSLKGRVWSGYVLALILLLISYLLIFYTIERSVSEIKSVTQSYNAINRLEALRATRIITIASLAVALITLLYSLINFNKENRTKEKAIEKARKNSIELESNVTELKTMNQELQELKNLEKFRATGRIARTLAHEVRNPLTNISLAAEQLQETTGQNPEAAVLLGMISRNATRINKLISELLNATRFAQLDFLNTDLNHLLRETLEMARDRIELNHIRVEESYSADSCTITVDVEKMKLAFLNIIVNAIEAMEKNKGVLVLKTKRKGNKCIIEIRDNGKGMPEDVLQNMFEPYFTQKQKGNGLGLTNSQNIIFNHKGTIKVHSKPGEGAVFVVELNLSE